MESETEGKGDGTMTHERRETIIQLVESERIVKAADLMERFGVSNETVRRDLEYLEKAGYLNRVYGGAVAKSMHGLEPQYENREMKNYMEKVRIGELAVEYIKDGDTIVVDLGTTTLQFAKALKGKRKVTVLTYSLPVALELVPDENIRVIMLGGNLRYGDLSTSGFLAEENMKHFYVDKFILGIGGLTVDGGLTDYNIEESSLRRQILPRCQKVIGLADYSKIGVTAMNHICGLEALDVLITDQRVEKKTLAAIRDKGVEVVCVEADSQG